MLKLACLILTLSPLSCFSVKEGGESRGVISSFTIPDNWVGSILPAGYRHRSLVPARSELHGYQINANDAQDLTKAELIVGLSPELEPWLADWIKANHREDATLWLATEANLSDRPIGNPIVPDPHIWTDPSLVLKIIVKLRQKLQMSYPQVNMENAYNQLVKDIKFVDNTLNSAFTIIPVNQRRIITQHANLGPFAQFSKLLETIRIQGVRVVVVDDGQNDAIAQQLCRDTGIPPPLPLSFEFLEPAGTEGDTWAGMMLKNGRKLQTALLKP
ncbi:MAG: zinc ABC transporter substrate-binding protein [Verrucomicrobia bacterium]|nr:zinc ABC transporter substrate-binding protein [Verrucomicrobiota bacterium]